MLARMDQGALDFVFALSTTPLPPGVLSEPIARDRLALVMRAGHPWVRRRWRLKDYGAVEHVGISILGDAQSDLDAQLATHGVKRRMALTTPHFIAALAVVSATDMVTTISRTFAARFARTFGLVLREPPLATTEMQVTLVSSQVRASDPLLTWLRGVIRAVAERQERGLSRGRSRLVR
jgi:DNA-binding transcriptional LysR family regulator